MPSRFDLQKHHRRSIRLPYYDYSQSGAHYITLVTYQGALIFGEVISKEMQLSGLGEIADECWRAIPDRFPDVELGSYVIMPNHVHGIIIMRTISKTCCWFNPCYCSHI